MADEAGETSAGPQPTTAGLLQRRRALSGLRVDVQLSPTCAPKSSTQMGSMGANALDDLIAEKYELLESIGRGSSGKVFRAQRKVDGEEVALKMMNAPSKDIIASRREEFEVLQQLDHPNIVRGLDFFTAANSAVIVLSYHAGNTLYRAVRNSESGCFSECTTKHLFRMLLSALDYLHQRRVVHRDVKADNVLVSHDLTDLHLLDFNTARSLVEGGALTMTGTVEYSAPEVLKGESPSERHDVWGAGLCLHWMLMGTLPFSASGYASVADFEAAVLSKPVTCQEAAWDKISEDCREIIRLCLTISMSDRPAPMVILCLPWMDEEAPRMMPRQSTFPSFDNGRDSSFPSFDTGRDSSFPSFDAGRDSSFPSFDKGGFSSFPSFDKGGDASELDTEMGPDSPSLSHSMSSDSEWQRSPVLADILRLNCESRQYSPIHGAFDCLGPESRQNTPVLAAVHRLESQSRPFAAVRAAIPHL